MGTVSSISPEQRRRLTVVGLVVVIVLEAMALFLILGQGGGRPEFAYLIKNGDEFLVAWSENGPNSNPLSSRHRNLDDALAFARFELNVEMAASAHAVGRIEKLWVESNERGHVLQWKMENNPHLMRLTFRNFTDAEFFESAFRKGAYRPSPVGHAIVLLPPEKQPHSFY